MGNRSRSYSTEEEEKGSNDWQVARAELAPAYTSEVAEAAARELYARGRLDPADACGAPRLAASILGESCIQPVRHCGARVDGLLGWYSSWIINVSKALSARALNHTVAHELAEWWLEQERYDAQDREELANGIAARICVPTDALASAYREFGDDVAHLSRAFVVSQSLMALRIAEWTGRSTALLTSKRIRVRGSAWNWPSSGDAWLDLLRDPGASGLERMQLTDARSRIVLCRR